MTVLNPVRNGEKTSLLDNAFGAFVPKTVPSTTPRRELRRVLVAWAKRNSIQIRNGVFATVGFGSPCVAAFEWQSWAGWIAVGVAALLWDKAVNTDVRAR